MGKPERLNAFTGKVGQADHNRRDPRVYGNGFAALTPIEGAARAGYLDACAGRGFAPQWEAETGQWQRNYETGRLWAMAIRAIGEAPAGWPDGARVPQALLMQLDRVRAITGSGTRPEDTPAAARPNDTDQPLHAIVPRLVRGRIVERTTP
jgi:hypothetical protein